MATPGNSGNWSNILELEKEHPAGRIMSQALLKGLSHPVRRAVLRRLNGDEVELRPADLARELGLGLENLSHHMRMLAEKGILRCTEVDRENGCFHAHFYVSNVASNQLVVEALEDMEEEDRSFMAEAAWEKPGRCQGRSRG